MDTRLLMLIVDESRKEELEVFLNRVGEALERLRGELREYCRDCDERLKMVVWSVEEVSL